MMLIHELGQHPCNESVRRTAYQIGVLGCLGGAVTRSMQTMWRTCIELHTCLTHTLPLHQ